MADIKEILVGWDVGESMSGIARRLGYTRVTVRKYVQAAEQVGLRRGAGRRQEAEWDRLAQAAIAQVATPRARGPASSAVAQYHAYLDQRIGTAPLTVLHQRLRDEQGLRASWRTFHRYIRAQWPERLHSALRTTIRLEDPPGEEAQVDFFYVGYWHDPAVGHRRKLYALLMTLSQSRHQFLYPCVAEDSTAWLEGHLVALHFFGGAPRRVVPDNLTAGIRKADRYDPRVNRAYGELARHYGFLVDPARVQHPQDKAKVERGVPYARASFFAGRTWDSLAVMRADARGWCLQTAGIRRHGTTAEQPLVAFQEREQAALQPLPPQPWERATWTSAAVHSDCHVRAGHAWYSVPYRYVGQRLDVRLGERLVTIYDAVNLVATHLRRPHGRATQLEHYPPAGQAFLRATPQTCLEQARQLGPATGALVRALLEPYTLTRLREVQAVLRLREHYTAERLERACQRALSAGDGRYRTVRGILERSLDTLELEAPVEPRGTHERRRVLARASGLRRCPLGLHEQGPSRGGEGQEEGGGQGGGRGGDSMLTLDALQPRLRQLKLSGMRDAIGARVEEARARSLDPLEFLALLLDDEVVRREADSVARRIHQARFEEVCDLRDFDWSYNPEIPKARLWELASGLYLEETASLVLCGPTGVGKSFVAQALGVEACRQQRRVLFLKTSAFLSDLAGGRADGTYPARLRRYLIPTLLILDDFGLREYSVSQSEDLYELVSRRYRRGSFIFTTNRAPQDLYPLFPNPVLAEGLLDRLLNNAHIVTMVGKSYRPRQRPAGDVERG